MDDLNRPPHNTRDSWWLVAGGALTAASLPHLIPWPQQHTLGIWADTLIYGGLGALAATLLVGRSHVRSLFWSNVFLTLGILVVAIGIVATLVMTIPLHAKANEGPAASGSQSRQGKP